MIKITDVDDKEVWINPQNISLLKKGRFGKTAFAADDKDVVYIYLTDGNLIYTNMPIEELLHEIRETSG